MSWWARNAASIEAIAATVTALVAVAALVGIKVQLDSTERQQQAQSARDAYRAHLALAVTKPDFAQPEDSCILLESPQGGAYSAFVDHLLYSAEQMLVVDAGWDTTFLDQLSAHAGYLCSASAPAGDTDETAALLTRFRAQACGAASSC